MTQPALDFTAAPVTVYQQHQAEVDGEARRRHGAADRVLDALRAGPRTNLDLITICQRISGRIFDLRRRGHSITVEPVSPGVFRYTLHDSTGCR